MRIVVATVDMKPEHRERFIEEMLLDARGSVETEPGCLRFDVLQDNENPNRLYLYEVYRDEAEEEAHMKTPHFLRWDRTVKDWFASPLSFSECTNIFPTDEAWH